MKLYISKGIEIKNPCDECKTPCCNSNNNVACLELTQYAIHILSQLKEVDIDKLWEINCAYSKDKVRKFSKEQLAKLDDPVAI